MPTEEDTYRNGVRKDIQNLKDVLELRMNTFEYKTSDSLQRIEIKIEGVETQVKFTNGKVRKIIIAIVGLSGVVVGMTFNNVHDIIQLIANII